MKTNQRSLRHTKYLFVGMIPPEKSSMPLVNWSILAGILLLGIGFFVVNAFREKRWSPNTKPQAERLRLAQQVSLSRDTYLDLAPLPRPRPPTTAVFERDTAARPSPKDQFRPAK